MALPPLTDVGELPIGVHRAHLSEVLARFGAGSAQRQAVALRLARVNRVAGASGHLARFIVVTVKPEPADLDVFLLMEDTFDASRLTGEARLLFDHPAAQTWLGASVFWLRRLAALEGEGATIEQWQITRDGSLRGIIEIAPEAL